MNRIAEIGQEGLMKEYNAKALQYSVEKGQALHLPQHETIDGVDVVNVCGFLDIVELDSPCYEMESMVRYDGYIARICKVFNADFYSSERETFNLMAAVDQAKQNGKTLVLVEDLS